VIFFIGVQGNHQYSRLRGSAWNVPRIANMRYEVCWRNFALCDGNNGHDHSTLETIKTCSKGDDVRTSSASEARRQESLHVLLFKPVFPSLSNLHFLLALLRSVESGFFAREMAPDI